MRQKTRRGWIGLALLAIASLAGCGRAGGGSDGWVSSGGELFQDRQNAWWLKNVTDVGYCIRVEEKESNASEAGVERALLAAIKYWKGEFAAAGVHPFFGGKLPEWMAFDGVSLHNLGERKSLGIATQKFSKVPCAKADLEIVVGASALTPKQRGYFGSSLRGHLAAAVRTQYDEEKLRGKGFLFVASDRGESTPRALRGKDIPDAPMANETFVSVLLAHEMGHVFGIAHQGVRNTLMAERFPETLTRMEYWRARAGKHAEADSIPHFLKVPDGWTTCVSDSYNDAASKFFGVKVGQEDGFDGCPSFSFDYEKKQIGITVYHTKTSTRKSVGHIENLKFVTSYGAALTLAMNPLQQVFPDVTADFLVGPPILRSAAGPGVYVPVDGRPKMSVHYSVENSGCWRDELYGVLDGHITGISVSEFLCF